MKSIETRRKMAEARRRWYKNNPEKALIKSKKMSLTKRKQGVWKGEKHPNFGSGKFLGIPNKVPWNKGLTKEVNSSLRRLSEMNKGDKNPNWKGDRISKWGVHPWIRKNKLKPKFCVRCKKQKPYDVANISGEYKRDINDFEWLCRSCHMISDGRIFNLKNQKEVLNG